MGVIALDCDDLFATWRDQARVLLGHGIDPSEVTWSQGPMADLLAMPTAPPEGPGPFRAKVPAALLSQLEQASRYRGEQRWNLLYEVLWRVAMAIAQPCWQVIGWAVSCNGASNR